MYENQVAKGRRAAKVHREAAMYRLLRYSRAAVEYMRGERGKPGPADVLAHAQAIDDVARYLEREE